MTGFIQRLLTRGTGQSLKSNQVLFQPRPRSRFESGLSTASMENDNTPETGRHKKATPLIPESPTRPPVSRPPETSLSSNKSTSPSAEDKQIKPERDREHSKTSALSSPKNVAEFTENTGPAPSNPTTAKASNKDPEKTSFSPEKISKPVDVSSNQFKSGQEKQGSKPNILQSHILREPKSQPIQENIPHISSKPENQVKQLFKVIEEHNSKVAAQEKEQNDLPIVSAAEIQEIEEKEKNENPVNTVENPGETQAPTLIENRQEFPEPQGKAGSTGVTVSIGQIQVEFIQPETKIMQQPKPTIQRTRGFEDYSRARRGNPRR